jgi:hypothetical protein
MPNVAVGPVDTMGVQIGKGGVITVAVKCFLRIPLDKYENVARRNVAHSSLMELSQCHDATTVRYDFFGRSSRISKIFVFV